MSTNPEIDLKQLQELSLGDPAFVKGLLTRMHTSLGECFVRMEKALTEANWPELKAAAHKAKSSFAYLGLENIRDLFRLVEFYSYDELRPERLPDLTADALRNGELVREQIALALEKLG